MFDHVHQNLVGTQHSRSSAFQQCWVCKAQQVRKRFCTTMHLHHETSTVTKLSSRSSHAGKHFWGQQPASHNRRNRLSFQLLKNNTNMLASHANRTASTLSANPVCWNTMGSSWFILTTKYKWYRSVINDLYSHDGFDFWMATLF